MENIFLIGFRCSGKTAVGKSLASLLSWPFLDTDVEIVEKENQTIKEMVTTQGWDYFREAEKKILEAICTNSRQVIATGGGVVLDPGNVTFMGASGVRVWLRTRLETIRHRMVQDQKTDDFRPAFTQKNTMEEIREVMSIREPIYLQAADKIIDTDHMGISDVSHKIIHLLE